MFARYSDSNVKSTGITSCKPHKVNIIALSAATAFCGIAQSVPLYSATFDQSEYQSLFQQAGTQSVVRNSTQPKVSSADLSQIQSVADAQGYAPITVSFNVDSSLSSLLKNPSGIAAQAAQMESALLTSLGTNAIQSTVYRNGAGQSEIYVRKAALPLVDANPNVV